MHLGRNKYLGWIVLLLAVATAGFVHAHNNALTGHAKAVHASHTPKYGDAVVAHRFHQNHFKRHRFNLDGLLPAQQDTVLPIVTGTFIVAPVQDQHFPTPLTPSLRGPPTAA